MCLAGTFISAFSVLCGARSELISERGVCCVFWLNMAAALIQILTAVIMVGWIMSIFWGMDMVILASQSSTICSSALTVLVPKHLNKRFSRVFQFSCLPLVSNELRTQSRDRLFARIWSVLQHRLNLVSPS